MEKKKQIKIVNIVLSFLITPIAIFYIFEYSSSFLQLIGMTYLESQNYVFPITVILALLLNLAFAYFFLKKKPSGILLSQFALNILSTLAGLLFSVLLFFMLLFFGEWSFG